MSLHLISSFFQRLTYFYYGTRLLQPGAAVWLVSMFGLACAVSLLEGTVWAYVLSLYLPAEYAHVSTLIGVLMGGGTFLWDSSFITLDVRAAERRTDANPARPVWFFNRVARAALLRVVVMLCSLLVAGPLIVRALQERTFEFERSQYNAHVIAKARQGLAAQMDTEISTLQQRIADESERYVQETSGTKGRNTTGKGGKGPAAEAIRHKETQLRLDLARLQEVRIQRLKDFDATSPDVLSKQYALSLLGDDAAGRAVLRARHAQVQDTILGMPADHVIATTVMGLLAAFLVGLKLNQPNSVAMYFDEMLQSAFATYRRGGYAHLPHTLLSASQQHDGPCALDACAFEHWHDRQFQPGQSALATAQAQAAAIEQHQAALQRAQIRHDEACGDTHRAECELEAELALLASAQEEHAQAQADLEGQERLITELNKTMQRTHRDELETQRAQLMGERAEHQEQHAQLRHEHDIVLAAQLEKLVLAIRHEQAREGHISEYVAETARSATLNALMSHHAEALERKHELNRQRLLREQALAELDVAIEERTRALAAGLDVTLSDFGSFEPMLGALRRQRDAVTAECGTRRVRTEALQGQLISLHERVTEYRQEVERCAQARRTAGEEMRARQRGLAQVQDAALTSPQVQGQS